VQTGTQLAELSQLAIEVSQGILEHFAVGGLLGQAELFPDPLAGEQ